MSEETSSIQAKKHLKEILLLFSIPAFIVVTVIAFLYIPRLFANPTHDFIYCEGYSCENRFSVDLDGKLIVTDDFNRYPRGSNTLHYYDLEQDATRPIQAEEAGDYPLDPTSKSPDGYQLVQNSNNGGFLFWSDYRNSWSLKKGLVSKPVSIQSYEIKFIGWVKDEE